MLGELEAPKARDALQEPDAPQELRGLEEARPTYYCYLYIRTMLPSTCEMER